MSSLYQKIDNLLDNFLNTIKRFPLASFSAFLLTIIILILIDYTNYENPNAIIASKVAFVATLGILLFPALQLLGYSIIFPLLGIGLLGAYYYLLPHNIYDINFNTIVRHYLLTITLFFMIIWSPFIFRKSDNATFWQYAQSIIFGLITAIFFSFIIYGGLSIALYAVEKLFVLDIHYIRYAQLAIIVFGIFGINFFLSQIPKYPLFMQIRPYSNIKRIFSKNILAPIALVYFIILYSYTAKILLNMEWPTGILSWIIVSFSFVAIISFLFLNPYIKKSTIPQRLIWLAIFLQTIMLGVALWMRVEEYGITYNRYLLAIFGVWLLLMSLYFMLFGKAQQKWIFFFASLFILISQFGGEYSASSVSKKSQTQRLIKFINEVKEDSKEIDMKIKYQISDSIQYISIHYGIDTFKEIIPDILKKYKIAKDKKGKRVNPNYIYGFAPFATKELGFEFINRWDWLNYQRNGMKINLKNYHFYTNISKQIIDIKGYDYLLNYKYSNYLYRNPILKLKRELEKSKDLNLSITFSNNQLQIKHDSNISSNFDLNEFGKKLLEENSLRNNKLDKTPIYEGEDKNLRVKIFFQKLNIIGDGNITNFTSQIVIKSL